MGYNVIHMNEITGDLHVHTKETADILRSASYSLQKALEVARNKGHLVFAATEHGILHDYDKSQAIAERTGIILIPAVEIRALISESLQAKLMSGLFGSSRAFVDVLAYGVVNNQIPDQKWNIDKVIDHIHQQAGIAVVAHPSFSSFFNWYSTEGKNLIQTLGVDGIEVMNSHLPKSWNDAARKLAEELEKIKTGGSDARSLKDIGKAYTIFDQNFTIRNWRDCLKALKSKTTDAASNINRLGPFFW